MEQECLGEWMSNILAIERTPNSATKDVEAATKSLAEAKARLADAKKAATKTKGLREQYNVLQKLLNDVAAAVKPKDR